MVGDTLQRILSLGAPIAIIGGVVIALVQLRNQQHLRQMDIVMRLYAQFGEEQFLRHFRRVSTWPYPTYEAYRQNGTHDDWVSLMVVSVFFENMGLLLKRDFASIELLDDLLSGPLLDIWPRVKPIWVGLRVEHDQASWSEWFEYFHDAIAARTVRAGALRASA